MSAAIEVENLTKVFKTPIRRSGGFGARLADAFAPRLAQHVAIKSISFAVQPGERVAFIGPNGAGKSTTLKILSGIMYPDSGEARVLGRAPWGERRALAFRVGTVFGQRSQLWQHLPPSATFDLLAHVYEQPRAVHRRRRDQLVEAFDIGPFLARPVKKLSLGERMRCEIVASLLHAPEVLFLDEPTIGLDVTAKAAIRELIRDQSHDDGMTLLLTSHDTGDIERVCDRVIVIHRGRLVVDRPVRELRGIFIKQKLVTLMTAKKQIELVLPGVRTLESEPYRTVLEVSTDQTGIGEVIQAALDASPLRDVTVSDPPLEQIVRQIYARADAHDLVDAADDADTSGIRAAAATARGSP